MKRTLCLSAAVLALLLAAASGVVAQRAQAPKLDVEPLWPKPFPASKAWILGSVTGVAVDGQDRVWVVHRGVDSLQTNEKGPTLEPWASSCCFAAPQVLAFDAAGNLVANFDPKAGSGYDWPVNPSGIAVDDKGNVWIGSGLPTPSLAPAGRGGRGAAAPGAPAPPPPPADAQVLKFDKAGKFLLQIGKGGNTAASDSPTGFNRPGALAVDSAANELYVADGFGNHRIAVFDATTGAFKRSWGAYGEKPNDTDPGRYDPAAPASKQFRTLSCVKIAKDGMVYVCDRQNNRVQVFEKSGKFVKEAVIAKATTGDGAVWDVAFSPDQRLLYVADGHNKKVRILDRSSLEEIGTVGSGGRYPGQFYGVGSVAVDSKGNLYTGETYEGKRVQKFVSTRRSTN
jgi:DNA-binding beta-propeller fold protein YncE